MSTIVRLLKLIGPMRWWMAAGILLSAATSIASVGLMGVSAYLISKSALVEAVIDLSLLITGVRFFALARAGLRYAERYVNHKATFRILTRLRVWFYASIEPLAPARLMPYQSGDLLARITADIETLENFYLRVVVPPAAAVLVVVFAVLVLGSFDLWLGLTLLLFALLAGVGLPLASRRLSALAAATAIDTRAAMNVALVDEIQGIADLLAYNAEAAQQARALALSRQWHRLQEKLAMIRGLANGLAALLASLAGMAVLALSIPLVTAGRIDGVFLALLPLTAIVTFEAIQPLAQAFQTLESCQAAARRIFELIDAPPPVPDPAQPAAAPDAFGIEVRDLSFRYAPDASAVLDKVNFDVAPGERLLLIGPNGAGKSTLVNLLARFWAYEEGTIRLGGKELGGYAADDVRDWLAVVPQHTHLFNATIRDNLYLANPEAADAQIEEVCRLAQLDTWIQSLPDGYDTMVGENGVRISGGERQRLAIARALLKDAPVLILDEPTSQLDAVTEVAVWRALEAHMAGRTTIIIAHRRPALDPIDRVVALGG